MSDKDKHYIFLHGLGQNPSSWENVFGRLTIQNSVCLDLFSMLESTDKNYYSLYAQFEKYCDNLSGEINICGISLGAVLALNYAVKHLQKVKSLILIAPQFKIPKVMLSIQNIMFRFMPERIFLKNNISKKDMLSLTKSMMRLDIQADLEMLECPIMIICGDKDIVNRHAAISIHKKIRNSKLHFIKQAGHEVNVDAPERLSGIMEEFWIKFEL